MSIRSWIIGLMLLRTLILAMAMAMPNVALAGWDDWWQTPQQKAASAFAQEDHQSLLDTAPDKDWTGLAQFQSGDYQSASNTFKQYAQEQREQGNIDAATRSLYNLGVSEAMAGRYQEAIDSFDRVLQDNPSYNDAAHNKQLAEQLLSIEQQQRQQQDADQSESGEQNDQPGENSGDSDGDQSAEQPDQQGEPGEQSQQGNQSGDSTDKQPGSDSQTEGASQSQADESSGDESQGLSEEQQQQAAEDAAQALQAEAQQQQEDGQSADEQTQNAGQYSEQPMTESEQATEQLLRRIPDDPAGLLRRKLEQSHRSEFPEVRDAIEPW